MPPLPLPDPPPPVALAAEAADPAAGPAGPAAQPPPAESGVDGAPPAAPTADAGRPPGRAAVRRPPPPPAPPSASAAPAKSALPTARELRRDPVEAPLIDPPPGGAWRELLVSVNLNGRAVSQGTLFAERQGDGGTLAIQLAALELWRVGTDASRVITFQGEPYYPLAAIEGAKWVLDREGLALKLDIPAGRFAATRLADEREAVPPPAAGTGRLPRLRPPAHRGATTSTGASTASSRPARSPPSARSPRASAWATSPAGPRPPGSTRRSPATCRAVAPACGSATASPPAAPSPPRCASAGSSTRPTSAPTPGS
jgi:hypothetical protein